VCDILSLSQYIDIYITDNTSANKSITTASLPDSVTSQSKTLPRATTAHSPLTSGTTEHPK